MLDTHGRKFIEPLIEAVARALYRLRLTANGVSVLAMIIGVFAAMLLLVGWKWSAIGALWVSGLLDAADGELARMTRSSQFGAIIDITGDRIVEVAVIVALAWRYAEARFALVILAGAIAVAMSLFLSIAAALPNNSSKSFHYAPGLGERTEAFIFLSLMIADPEHLHAWSWLFIGVIIYTMAQRLVHAARALRTARLP